MEEDFNLPEGVASGDPYSLLVFGEFDSEDRLDSVSQNHAPVTKSEAGPSVFLIVLFVLWVLGSLAG